MKRLKKYFIALLAVAFVSSGIVSCGDNILPDPRPDDMRLPDAEILKKADGIIEIKEGIGDWDAAYVSSEGYFCMKDEVSGNDASEMEEIYSIMSYMSADETEKSSLISTKNDNLPTQLVSEEGTIYFNYPNDTIIEILYEKGEILSKIDDIRHSREEISETLEGLDDFKARLRAAARLLLESKNSESEGKELVERYGELFSGVSGKEYTENTEVAESIATDEDGNYGFAETISDWYEDEVKETVNNTLTLWTGEAAVDDRALSCTLNGAIYCASPEFNELGTYGIICDENVENLFVGKAKFEGKGFQSADGKGFNVRFSGLKPGATYYYRTYYRFNTSNHGSLIPKNGSNSDQVIYDLGVKSFTVEEVGKDRIVTVNGVSFKMIYVEGGTFLMGSTNKQFETYSAHEDEIPIHSVTVSSFYMAETEVTQALWYSVMGYKPAAYELYQWSSDYGLGDNYPAYNISYYNCLDFIKRLNELTGMTFRMPTEAEWEYAARGGFKSRGYIYSGSNNVGDVAWYDDNSFFRTHPVKTKAPNELGLYDMSGNVWEWCSDRYDSSYYAQSGGAVDPTGPASGFSRVLRGGCWFNYAGYCRVANRSSTNPGTNYNKFGLRLVSL